LWRGDTDQRIGPSGIVIVLTPAGETVVHRVDAEQATGAVGPLGPALVLDGIAESLEVFAPLMARREQDPATATVHLHATDVEGEWLLTLGGSTVAVEHGHAKGDAAVRGTAAYLTCGCGPGPARPPGGLQRPRDRRAPDEAQSDLGAV